MSLGVCITCREYKQDCKCPKPPKPKVQRSGSAKFVVSAKITGSKLNRKKIEERIFEELCRAMEMDWTFTGSGTVEVEWEISQNEQS